MRDYFHTYSSNTLAGSGNQTFFWSKDPEALQKGRVYYKIFAGGSFHYSLLYTNITDGTFADGSHSRCNRVLDPWQIHSLQVAVVQSCTEEPACFIPLTFGGKTEKTVSPGEFLVTDPVMLNPEEGAYLCVEITFSGRQIPCHEESILPTFVWEKGAWVPSKKHPFPSMVGCDRPVKKRVAFLGDSITQGIGVAVNSYAHWNAVAADGVGREYGFWNLGLGYGRGTDAASDGAWLYKAKQNDIVVLCYGVNDLLWSRDKGDVRETLKTVVSLLQKAGVEVILQTVPPFNYNEYDRVKWAEVNTFLREELAKTAQGFFDCVPLLQKSAEEPYMAPYGGHPNEEGCKIWGDAMGEYLLNYLKK